LFTSLHGVLQNLLEFQLFLLRERPHTSHHRNLNGDLSITDDRGERLSHRRSSNLPLLLRARRGGLKEMFQCMFATEERPQALLKENSGANHGQKAVPQANPSAMKQSVRERRRRTVEVLVLSALPPSPEVICHT